MKQGKAPYWSTDKKEHWVCPNHHPATKIPAAISECWYSNCDSKRPPTGYCAWEGCTEGPDGKPAPRREKSIYCSRSCSNKNARHRHSLRKQAKAA